MTAPSRLATTGTGALLAMVGGTPRRVAEAVGHAVAAGQGIRARPTAALSAGTAPTTAWIPAARWNTRTTGRPAELQRISVHARMGAPAMDEAVRTMRAPVSPNLELIEHDSVAVWVFDN